MYQVSAYYIAEQVVGLSLQVPSLHHRYHSVGRRRRMARSRSTGSALRLAAGADGAGTTGGAVCHDEILRCASVRHFITLRLASAEPKRSLT